MGNVVFWTFDLLKDRYLDRPTTSDTVLCVPSFRHSRQRTVKKLINPIDYSFHFGEFGLMRNFFLSISMWKKTDGIEKKYFNVFISVPNAAVVVIAVAAAQ